MPKKSRRRGLTKKRPAQAASASSASSSPSAAPGPSARYVLSADTSAESEVNSSTVITETDAATTSIIETAAEPSALWPYHKRLNWLQTNDTNYVRACDLKDNDAIMNCMMSMLSVPYNQVGGLRSCGMIPLFSLLHCEGFVAGNAFSRNEDKLRFLLKCISHNEKEHPCTRIMALINRATGIWISDTSTCISDTSTCNYIRQALRIAKLNLQQILDFPDVINVARRGGAAYNLSPLQLIHSSSEEDGPLGSKVSALLEGVPERFQRTLLLSDLNRYACVLEFCENLCGKSMTSAHLPPIVAHMYPFTIGGGYCDGCGKSLEEAGLDVLFKCERCRLAHYCSPVCQSNCWAKGHSDHCKRFGRFQIGDTVILQSLKNEAELNNNVIGIVEARTSSGRWAVRPVRSMDLTNRGMHHGVVAVKPENIRHARPPK